MNLRSALTALWRGWIRPLALPVLLITAGKSALADINYVPTGSMQPTILAGDVVFINKLAYDLRVPFTFSRLAQWSNPKRGDVVVCFSPADGTRLVKRVVALPGDTVELRDDVLWLNGQPQPHTALPAADLSLLPEAERARALVRQESFGARSHTVMLQPSVPSRRNVGPLRVPADTCFVLGDNRANSLDSRFFGFVPRREIIGQVRGVFVSADLERWLRPRFDRWFIELN